jgi:hypothetical protein
MTEQFALAVASVDKSAVKFLLPAPRCTLIPNPYILSPKYKNTCFFWDFDFNTLPAPELTGKMILRQRQNLAGLKSLLSINPEQIPA